MRDRLNYLFETVRPAGKARYSVRDVAEAIKRDQGFDISASYINHICTGERENPGVQQVAALAKFFGVPPSFLFGDGDHSAVLAELVALRNAIRAKEELAAATADGLQDPQVRFVALKARGLSESNLGAVAAILDQIRQIEGLPRDEPDAEQS
jgi:transcriptional regulator with XRE-family HTH domain